MNLLITFFSAAGCPRHGVSLAFVEWKEGIVTDRLTAYWSSLGVFNWGPAGIVFRPHKISVTAAVRKLRSGTHEPWRSVCTRFLGSRFIEYASSVGEPMHVDPWVFADHTRSKLMAIAGRKNMNAALDRLLPQLERDILGGILAQWALPEGVGR